MPYNRPIPQPKQPHKLSSGLDALLQAETAMQIALVLPSAVVVGWLLGAWADSHWHQSWITIAGIVLGCVSGLVYVIRMALSALGGPGPYDSSAGGKGTQGPRT